MLVKRINDTKNIYLCPSEVKGKYIIRFAVCAKSSTLEDIEYSWKEITRLGDQILYECNETKFHLTPNNKMSAIQNNNTNSSNNTSPSLSNHSSSILKINGKMHLPDSAVTTINRSMSEVSVVGLPRLDDLKMAYTNLLEAAGEDINREGLLKTPERAAKAFQFFTAGYHQDIKGESPSQRKSANG